MTTATDWSGRVGEVWAEEWPRTEQAFAALEPEPEAALLAVAPDHGRALDIGCGVGTTSLAVARARPDVRVIGADLSPGMVAIARERASGTANVEFTTGDVLQLVKDAQTVRHPGLEPGSRSLGAEGSGIAEQPRAYATAGFDLLFSRHGVMFFADPTAAFSTLRRAAAPGAPLVFSCFAAIADNRWATLLADAPARTVGYAPGPFAFADEPATGAILRAAGWRNARARRVGFRYVAGRGTDPVADAIAFFTRIGPAASAMRDAALDAREALMERLIEQLELHRRGDLVDFPAAAWLWTARA